ncbi:MAG TPA: DUF3300 domain-containing protein, partial [Dongiaceae bacterium]|nr:DUF3300 domain-containing protein [Dongiaceae bacterium]
MVRGCRFVGVRQGWLPLALAGALAGCLILQAGATSRPAMAQETAEATPPAGDEAAPAADQLLTAEQLESLVARVAYYPDEVLAVVLPASTFPVQIVQAARLLEEKKTKPDVKPGADWDPSVIALLNYPSVIDMMNKDLDWTTQLGNAVLDQQGDVMDAIQQVRQTAYAAGQLESNDKMKVSQDEQAITIDSADPEKVYVPVYQTPPAPEPVPTSTSSTTVVVQQPGYYPPAYYPPPVYYSDPYVPYYNSAASFWTGAFVGAATGIALGYAFDWGNDDIDIDFNNNNINNWSPTRNRGDTNIGNRTNVGNRGQVQRGDSWRSTRANTAGGRAGEAGARNRNRAVQPTAGMQNRAAGNRPAAGNRAAAGGQRPAGAQNKRQGQVTGARTQQKGQNNAFSANQRGRDAQKAGNRGAQSRQPTAQSRTQSRQPAGQSRAQSRSQGSSKAFGGVSNGARSKQFSGRGASSRQAVRRR